MVDSLISFGLAIGWMDIFGSICFQFLVVFMLLRMKPENAACYDPAIAKYSKKTMFIFYLMLLNAWIIVTILMMYGIVSHKAGFILPWLIWCCSGLILDVFFMMSWFAEVITGDVIEAVTNILISILTMAIEVMFISIIYSIYKQSS